MDRFLRKEVWEPNSGAPGLAREGGRRAVGARIEAPNAPKGWGVGGAPLPHWGPLSGGEPLPGKIDFRSQIGEFWCKVGAFCRVHL